MKNTHTGLSQSLPPRRFQWLLVLVLFALYLVGIVVVAFLYPQRFLDVAILGVSFVMIAQGVGTFLLMTYAWNDPRELAKIKSPEVLDEPHRSFTALIAARHEEAVIADTLQAVAAIDYPDKLKEAIIICSADDTGTIHAVRQALAKLRKKNIKLVISKGSRISKPHSLNVGLKEAVGEVVVVFDAEDEPNADIYAIVNTVIEHSGADVVQSGVQLVNPRSRWFSTLNVLEYFFWFKSFLVFFSKFGLIPLGGNTVFFKREWLTHFGGWDEDCLTEDAEIGIRMSAAGANIRVVYDETHVTREETPLTIGGFIRQRTRWNQGFLQVLKKGDWMRLPRVGQQMLAIYVLAWPVVQAAFLFYLPISLALLLGQKVSVVTALISNIPTYLLVLQLSTLTVGMYEFSRRFNVPYRITTPLRIIATFFPYQILLGISAFRAFWRALAGTRGWEKTHHVNVHRAVGTVAV